MLDQPRASQSTRRPSPSPLATSAEQSSDESVERMVDGFGRPHSTLSTAELQRSVRTKSILLPNGFDPYAYGGSTTSSEITTPATDSSSIGEKPLDAARRYSSSFENAPVFVQPGVSPLSIGSLDLADPWGLNWGSSSPYDVLAPYMATKRSPGPRRPSSIASSPAELSSGYTSSQSLSTGASLSTASSQPSALGSPSTPKRELAAATSQPMPSPPVVPPRRRTASTPSADNQLRGLEPPISLKPSSRTRSKMSHVIQSEAEPAAPRRSRMLSWLNKPPSPASTLKAKRPGSSRKVSAESSPLAPAAPVSSPAGPASSPAVASSGPRTHPAHDASAQRPGVQRQPSLPPGAAPSRALAPPKSPQSPSTSSFMKRSASSLHMLFGSSSKSEPATRKPSPAPEPVWRPFSTVRSNSATAVSSSKPRLPPGLGGPPPRFASSKDRAPTPPPKLPESSNSIPSSRSLPIASSYSSVRLVGSRP